jgi:autotransporter-associated beta strand protein
MMTLSPWRLWLKRLARSLKTPPAARKPRPANRLLLESLEERLAPATDVWTGLGGNTNWGTAANWSAGVPVNGADLVFPSLSKGSLRSTNNLTAASFNSITFSGSGYTLSGNAITLGGSTAGATGQINVNAGVTNDTVALNLTLGGAADGQQQVFDVENAAGLTISGALSGTAGAGLTKTGAGTLTLAADNSAFTGAITVAAGIVQITSANALGTSSTPANATTVQQNAQIQVSGLSAPVPENLTLSGPGPINDGALLNVAGTTTWAGTLTLDGNTNLGASAGTLNLVGQITDLGAGWGVDKVGAGQVVFSHAGGNAYRGTTTVDNGILTIQDPGSLGNSPTTPNRAVVNYNAISRTAGTLQIDNELAGRSGFVVANELLTLNGPGFAGMGALDNLKGNNAWTGNVTLGSPVLGSNVTIGVESQAGTPTDLLLSGVVGDPTGAGPFALTKVGTGRLIFTSSNTYLGPTTVAAGILNVEDSQALGPKTKTNGTTVYGGAALELQLQADDIAGLIPAPAPDSVTKTTNALLFTNPLTISGSGVGGTGALHSVSGINTYTGNIVLAGTAAIGVEPDPNASASNLYFTNDFSLTVGPTAASPGTGVLSGGSLTKVDQGQLILPRANTYTGSTDIKQGWITVQDNQSLGAQNPVLPQTAQPYTTVEAGAALHLRPLVPGTALALSNNFILSGLGITHPFGLLSHMGALENQGGANTLSGVIQLNGVAGIGVEQIDPLTPPNTVPSQLTVTGTFWDASPVPAGGGGITKLGSQRLIIQGPGTYTGPVDIKQGVLLAQFDTALGAGVSTTTVEAGAALELATTTTTEDGGLAAGIEVWGERLVLKGTGNAAFGDGALTVLSGAGSTAGPIHDAILPADYLWNGPVTLGTGTVIAVQPDSRVTLYSSIDDAPNPTAGGSDLTLTGGGELDLGGSNTYRGTTWVNQGVLTVENSQALGGSGVAAVQTLTLTGATAGTTQFTLTFNGATTGPINYATNAAATNAAIQAALSALPTVGGAADLGGTATVAQSGLGVFTITFGGSLVGFAQPTMTAAVTTGPGAAAVSVVTAGGGGTVVANGASLQLAGGLTVAGEPLLVQGQGDGTAPNVPAQWFAVGPAPIVGGQTAGNGNVSGRVTGVAVNPYDPNVIYIATAGGGAWKTIDGGKTWRPLFDAIPDVQTVTVNATSGTFTLTFNGQTTTPLAVSATADQVQAALGALSSVGGAGGLVTVTQAGNVFTVTFGGALAGTNVPQMTASVPGVVVSTLENGADPRFALYVGAIALDPSNPNTVYLGTGETNNSPDSYYGTGVYESTDAGATWTLVTDNVTTPGTPINPFYGKGISKIIVSNAGTLYVASGDGGSGKNEVQTFQFNGFPQLAQTFTISFTAADATGNVVTDTTPTLTYYATGPNNTTTPTDLVNIAQEIQDALDAFSNIGGVGGFVNVTPPSGGRRGNRSFTVAFEGNLSLTTLAVMTTNWPLPGPGVSPPTIGVQIPVVGGPLTVVNGTSGGPGVWRYMNGAWFNLTAVVSYNRANTPGQGTFQAPPNGSGPPKTPGPDDDYRINFPQSNATWSDLTLVGGTLFAALGPSRGTANSGVFWTSNPISSSPVWYVGNPFSGTPPVVTPDARSGNEFPTGAAGNAVNGTIKISGVPGAPPGSTNFGPTVYAAVANPNGTLLNIFVTTDGGLDWSPVQATPANYLSSQGGYDNVILAVNPSTVFVGGSVNNAATEAGQILETSDAGQNWRDVSVLGTGGPHTSQHAMALDANGNLLVGNDGGIWRLNTATSTWTDLNGNLPVSQVNGVAADATTATTIFAGSQSNGTAEFTNRLGWAMVDDNAGGEMGGGQVFVDPTNPDNVYAVQLWLGSNAIVRRSTDGGQTWTTILQSPTIQSRTVPLSLDESNPNRLLVGGGVNAGLFESEDQGNTWINLSPPTNVTAIALTTYQGTFAPDPNFPSVTDQGANTYDPNTIYVTDGTNIFVTKDHGLTWADRSTGTALEGLGSIVDLEVDPRNRDTVYAVRSAFGNAQVFQSTDAGQDWTEIGATSGLPNVPAWTLAIDPRNNNLYVGNDLGVYELAGGAGTWQRVGAGLPNVQVKDLVLNQATNTLLAGTYGRSVFKLFLTARQTTGNSATPAFGALSGSSVWTGAVTVAGGAGALGPNTVTLGAGGTQALQNGIAAAQLNIVGPVSDLTGGSNPTLLKTGQGNVVFSGANVYGGETDIRQGVLIANNPHALSGSFTLVEPGTALQLESSVTTNEPLTLGGDGPAPGFDGHNTGALESIANNNTYTGPITLASAVTVGVDSRSTLTLTGAIGGPFSLTKELTGTLILNDANTYSGATLVNKGSLQLRSSSALAGSSGTTVLDGAQLQLWSPEGGPGVVVAGESLDLSGTGVAGSGALVNVSGSNTWGGPIVLDANPGFSPPTYPPGAVAFGVTGAADTLTLGGPISAALPSGLRKLGAGTLVLAGGDSYGGTTYIDAGTLSIQDPHALGNNNTQEQQRVTVTGPTGGTFTLTFEGAVTASLADNATAAQVAAALNALSTIGGVGGKATVTLTTVVSPTLTGGVTYNVYTVTFGTGGLAGLDLPLLSAVGTGGAVVAVSPVAEGGIGALVANGAALALDLDPKQTGTPQTVTGVALQVNGPGVNNHGALDNVSGANTWAGPITLGTGSALGVDGGTLTATGDVKGATSATLSKVGPGTLFFPTANDYLGTTLVQAGVLNIGNTGALGGPLTSEVQTVSLSGATTGTFTLTFKGQTTGPLVFNATAAQVQAALAGLSTVGAGNVNVTRTGNLLTVTFQGSLAGVDEPQLTATPSSGTSAVVTTVTQGGLGGTVVSGGGTLQLQNNITVSTEALQLSGPGYNGIGALDSASGSNTWDAAITLTGDASVGAETDPRLGISTLTVDQAIGEATAGTNLTKVGTGVVVFSGTAGNTYTGLTSVTAGTLQLNKSAGALAVPGNLTLGDATAASPPTGAVQLLANNQVASSATVTVNSAGLFDLNGHTQTVGALRLTGGTVALTGAASNLSVTGLVTAKSDSAGTPATVRGTGTLTLAPAGSGAGTTFAVNPGGGPIDLVVSAPVTGSGGVGLTKAGDGTMQIASVTSYPGLTEVTAGKLLVDQPGALGNVLVSGGILAGTGAVGTGSASVPALTATGGTVHPGDGPGTLTATGDVSFNANTTFDVTLNGTTAGSGYSQLVVNGNINLGGATLTGQLGSGFSPRVGVDSFTLIQTTGAGHTISGQFLQGTTALIAGVKFGITYNPTSVVLQRLPVATTTDVSLAPSSGVPNSTFTVTAAVTPDTPDVATTGTVSLTVAGPASFNQTYTLPVAGHTATLTLQGLNAGTYTVTVAKYLSSDPAVTNSQAPTTPSFTVNPDATSSALSATPAASSAFGFPVTFQVTVTPQTAGPVLPGQTVNFLDGGTPLPGGTMTLTPSGTVAVASYTTSALAVGTHNITASYGGDGNYMGSVTTPLAFMVQKASTTVTVASTKTDAVYGVPVITATVAPLPSGSGTPSGTVTFSVNGGTITETDTLDGSGVATLKKVLDVGTYTITATYSGDGNFLSNPTSNALVQKVSPAGTTTAVASSANPAVFGQAVTFTATVTGTPGLALPQGTVTFVIDGTAQPDVKLVTGQAALTLATLSVSGSPHTVGVTYNPAAGGDYTASSGSLAGDQAVSQAGTGTAVTADVTPSNYGQTVTFTAVVSAVAPGAGSPTGTVQFFDGTSPLGASQTLQTVGGRQQVQLAVSTFTVGAHPVTAQYLGDSNFTGSTSATDNQMVRATTATAVSSSSSPTVYGQPVTFTAVVSITSPALGTPGGSVLFFDGSTQIGSQPLTLVGSQYQAALTVSNLIVSPTAHAISAQYQGDTNYAGSSGAVTGGQTVSKAGTAVSFTSSNTSYVYGEAVIQAKVTPVAPGGGTPTGPVTFTIVNTATGATTTEQDALNGSGVATLQPLAPGSYQLTASYGGDSNFNGNTAPNTINQTVSQASTTTHLDSSANPAVFGQQVTFTATVSIVSPGAGTPTGAVTFLDGTTPLAPAVTLQNVGGKFQAALTLSSLALGGHTITASYPGDTNFTGGTSNAVGQTVNASDTVTQLTSSQNPSSFGQSVTFTATVSPKIPGGGLPQGTVTFFDGTTQLAQEALQTVGGKQQASFTPAATALAIATHSISAVYADTADSNYNGSTSAVLSQVVQAAATSTALTSSRITPVAGHSVTFTATVSTVPPNLGTPTGSVTFTVDGTTTTVSLAGGQAALTLSNLVLGSHTISAAYTNSAGNFLGSSSPAQKFTVLTPDQGYVAQVYRDLLHREAEAGGLVYWGGLLDGGALSRPQFSQIITSSPEYRADVIDALYVLYLRRHADAGGIAYFQGAMAAGTTDEQIAAFLAGSPEYFANRGGGTVPGFLNALYEDALNRPVDAQGLAAFTLALSLNVSRPQVAAAVLTSPEYFSGLVSGFYTQFLHRTADAGGVANWVNAMRLGLSDEAIVAYLIGSVEYFNNL